MLNFVRAWIVLSALLTSAGWILSAFHKLDRPGYLAVFLVALIALDWWRRNSEPSLRVASHQSWCKWRQRFQRPAPLFFLVLVLLALAGGALYVPTNIDTNAYRIPRVLHWLGGEQWHWIHTFDPRFNSTGCGFEWLTAPVILFTRTDRFLFLINWLSYLMLPGLIFSVFIRLGVRRRVAWWWMWFLSAGGVFIVQAGSTSNDAFSAIYALAAVDFALRAGKSKSTGDLWLSMLAVSLLTNVKQTNLPLLLPWLIAAGGSLKLLRARPLGTAAVAIMCLLVSVIPVTIGNLQHGRNWAGFSLNATGLENPVWANAKFEGSPFWGIVGNIFNITIQNLAPPYFPFAERWNAIMEHFTQTSFGFHFTSFDCFGRMFRFASETTAAGIGPGICLLTAASIWGAWKLRPAIRETLIRERLLRWLRLAPWLALLVFMAKTGSFAAGRYLAPYYPLLFPLVLTPPGNLRLVGQKWWQRLGLLVMLGTAMQLVISLDRPLFPAKIILGWLNQGHAQSHFVSSLSRLYGIESLSHGSQRNPFEKDLPQNERCIGYTSNGGLFEPGLWLPFGCRKVELIRTEDTPQRLRQLGVRYVVVDDWLLSMIHQTIAEWMERYDAELVTTAICRPQPTKDAIPLYLVRLR
jgi:hypothetical protein